MHTHFQRGVAEVRIWIRIWQLGGATLHVLVISALNQPYMFTRGRRVPRDDLYYGCAQADNDGCRTKPIPASRYDASRVTKCEHHRLPMDQPMIKVRRR